MTSLGERLVEDLRSAIDPTLSRGDGGGLKENIPSGSPMESPLERASSPLESWDGVVLSGARLSAFDQDGAFVSFVLERAGLTFTEKPQTWTVGGASLSTRLEQTDGGVWR